MKRFPGLFAQGVFSNWSGYYVQYIHYPCSFHTVTSSLSVITDTCLIPFPHGVSRLSGGCCSSCIPPESTQHPLPFPGGKLARRVPSLSHPHTQRGTILTAPSARSWFLCLSRTSLSLHVGWPSFAGPPFRNRFTGQWRARSGVSFWHPLCLNYDHTLPGEQVVHSGTLCFRD
jgi:hypothetical protein